MENEKMEDITGKRTILVRYLLVNNTDQLILAKEGYDEVKVFFRPKDFSPKEERIDRVINSLIEKGTCTGSNLERLSKGEIVIYFNPTVHAAGDRQESIRRVKKEIIRANLLSGIRSPKEG